MPGGSDSPCAGSVATTAPTGRSLNASRVAAGREADLLERRGRLLRRPADDLRHLAAVGAERRRERDGAALDDAAVGNRVLVDDVVLGHLVAVDGGPLLDGEARPGELLARLRLGQPDDGGGVGVAPDERPPAAGDGRHRDEGGEHAEHQPPPAPLRRRGDELGARHDERRRAGLADHRPGGCVGEVGAHRPQLGEEGPGVDRPGRRVAPGRPHDEVVQPGGDALDDPRRRRHVVVHVPVGHRHRALGVVRRRAGQQLEQQDAGGVDVGAGVGAAVLDLLRGEVGDGADEHAGRRGDRAGLDGAREAEVGDLDPAVVRQQDVLGLDVAVHEPGGVGGGERHEHRLEQVERPRRRQRALGAEHVAQGAAGHPLHHQVGGAGVGVGALVVDGDDLGARQPSGRARLAGEPLDELRVVGEPGRMTLTATGRSSRVSVAA